jgi:hypothetical protein
MRIWILENDKEEKCTRLKENFISKVQTKDFLNEQKAYHARNGVKMRAIKFKLEVPS